MAVDVELHLFMKPEHMLGDSGEPVAHEQLHTLARDMHEWLTEAGNVVKVMTKTGWEATMGMYDISLYHPRVKTAAQAKAKLAKLGIDPEKLRIEEFEGFEDD